VTPFERRAEFGGAYWPLGLPTIKTLVLLPALLAYAAGFAILYPIVAGSVAKSVAEGNDPALLQFVGP